MENHIINLVKKNKGKNIHVCFIRLAKQGLNDDVLVLFIFYFGQISHTRQDGLLIEYFLSKSFPRLGLYLIIVLSDYPRRKEVK